MRPLRDRLAQFDRARSTPARRRAPVSVDASMLSELGLHWVGEAPHGYLRLSTEAAGVPGPLPVDPCAWRRLAASDAMPPLPWAVLDTETTGLETGTGILIFMVGIVIWDGDSARTIQYLLPEPAGEAAMLDALAEDLEGCGALLSYNGKSFDVPRLRSRLRLRRRSADFLTLPHLDLLHPCRRLAKDWLEDARLATVEAGLLGRARVDDLPGSEAPDAYRDFLRGEGHELLGRVLLHNRRDIENLPALAVRLAELYSGEAQTRELPLLPRAAVGRALELRGDAELAMALYRDICESDEAEAGRRAGFRLAHMLKRRGEFLQALEYFEQCARRSPLWIAPRVEMAKLYEHRQHDLEAARRVVLESIAIAVDGPHSDERGVESGAERAALVHRLARIESKRSRQKSRDSAVERGRGSDG